MIAFLLLLAPPDVSATVAVDRSAVRLSEWLTVTVTVEGPAPLIVQPAADWVDTESAANWRIRPLKPATVSSLANGRERWVISLRADPYAVGDPLSLNLTALNVRFGNRVTPEPVTLSSQSIKVTSDVASVRGDEARGITGIERLPEEPRSWTWPIAIGLAVAMLTVAVGYVIGKRIRKHWAGDLPDAWLTRAWLDIERTDDPRMQAEKLAALVRRAASSRFGTDFTAKSVNEIQQQLENANGGEEMINLLKDLEQRQFDPSSNRNSDNLLAQTKAWINT